MMAPHPHSGALPIRELPHDYAVVRAAQWLADQREWQTRLRNDLRSSFSLTTDQVAEAVELSHSMRQLRRAFG